MLDEPRRGGLLRDHDFRHFWTADILSQVGSRMGMLAFPLLAVLTLNASTFQVAMLRVAETAGPLAFGLVVGAWVDRLRCRPLMIAADVGRAALLVSIPVAAVLDRLTLGHLYVVLLLVGVLTVVFDVAHQTYLPRLVRPADLVDGNAKLATNVSVGAVAGSGLGGFAVQWLTAPLVVLVDAATYLWSAVWLRGIRHREVRPEPERRALRHEIGEGLRFVFSHPVLRPIALNTASVVLFQAAGGAITVVFLVREIGVSPGVIGLLGMFGLVGAIVSSLTTAWIAERLGSARAMWIASVVIGAGYLLFPLTRPGPAGLVVFLAGTLVTSFGIIVLNILQATARQQLCPERLLGRVSATMQLTVWATVPVGSLVGAVLAAGIGMRGTLWLCGVMISAAALWLICSPLRRMRDLPTG